jgi:PAS domain S-box-containing protein
MNPYIPLHFLAAFSYLFLGIYSHLQDRKAQANRVFLVLCLVTALWAFCVGSVLLSPTQREADFWYFLSAPGWCFAPGLVLCFSVALIRQNRPSRWFLVLPFYLPGIVFLGQSILDFAMYRAIVSFSFPLPWDLAYTAYYIISLVSSILLIWRWGLQTKTKRERQQARILGTTLTVGLALILLNETVLPDLGIVFIPRIPAVLMLVWAGGIFYAITRYRLLQLTPALTASWINSQVNDLLFLINPDNSILQTNANAAKTLGYREEELSHQSVGVLLPSEPQGFSLQQGVDTPIEISRVNLRSKAGTSIPVHLHITPFFDPAGDRLGTLFLAQDLRPLIDLETQIAERERAEEILKQSESLYRTLAEAAQDIIFIVDESDIIQYVNNFGAQMTGKTTKDLVGQKQAALFPPEIASAQREHIRQVLSTGEPQYVVSCGHFPQGEIWLGTWLVPTRVDHDTIPAVMGVSRNITDEKTNQKRLQELLESYRKLFETFPYGAMLMTFNGAPVIMNRRMEEVLAIPRPLLWRDTGPEDAYPELSDREELLRAIEQNGGRLENYQMIFRRLDGEIFPAEISVEPVRYLGRSLRLVCLQDISERQRVEKAMRLAELQWSQFLGAAPDLMWIKNLSGRYLAANQIYLDTEQRAAAELIGLTDAEVYSSEDAALFQYTDQVAIKGGVSEGEFLRTLQKELRVFWVKKVPLRSSDGEISGILGLARDVTEWKRVENALRETESQFRLLFDESPVPLWQMDLSQVRRLIEEFLLQGIRDISTYLDDQPHEFARLLNCKHLVRVNKEGLRLFDANSIEELEAGFSSLFPPESIPLFQKGMEALLAGQVEHQAEIPMCTLTGEVRYIVVRLVLSPGSEASWQNTLISFQDITARHRAEKELERNREQLEEIVHERTIALEKTNVALKALAQKLVEAQETERREIARELHDDIGQELTGLKLSLERSSRKAPTELRSGLKGADDLVSGILTKIRDMALNLRPSMLDDLGLLPALLYQFERFTTHTHIEIEFQHIGLEIRFSPEIETAVFRILQEALTNVARHAKTSEVWITMENRGEELWLTVKDQGVGFDPEQGLTGGESTGLKGIRERVSAIGGSFVLESTPGCGSLLKVQLPLWEKEVDPTT